VSEFFVRNPFAKNTPESAALSSERRQQLFGGVARFLSCKTGRKLHNRAGSGQSTELAGAAGFPCRARELAERNVVDAIGIGVAGALATLGISRSASALPVSMIEALSRSQETLSYVIPAKDGAEADVPPTP